MYVFIWFFTQLSVSISMVIFNCNTVWVFGCCLGQVPLRQRLQDYKSDKYMSPVAIDFVMACIAILVLIIEDDISMRTQPLLTHLSVHLILWPYMKSVKHRPGISSATKKKEVLSVHRGYKCKCLVQFNYLPNFYVL